MRRAGMQRKKSRAILQILLAAVAIAGALELALALTVRLCRPRGQSVAASVERVPGPLEVGAATHLIDLPPRGPLAGFGLFRREGTGWNGPPWEARAIVIGRLAIVSLDVLEIPASLAAVISEKVGRNLTVWVCATHTHSGPGGYDPERLPQLAGARRFEPPAFEALADAAAAAVSAASWGARPATLRWARSAHPELKNGRSPAASPDPSLWALEARDENGKSIATLVGFGSHPTLVSRSEAQASADWPGAAAAQLDDSGGVGIVVQSIGGDSSAHRPADPLNRDLSTIYGRAVAEAARQSLAPLPFVQVLDQGIAQEPARLTWNLVDLLGVQLPATVGPVGTAVRMATVGKLRLICLPGELTGAAWSDLKALDPDLEGTWPVSLCGDELSYVESPRLTRARTGERLVLYPDAVPALGKALQHLSSALP